MKAFLINPTTKTISQLDMKDGGYEELKDTLQKADPRYSGKFDIVRMDDTESIYIDDEGMCEPGREVFTIKGSSMMLAGCALLIGGTDEGDSADSKFTLEEVQKFIVWTTLESTGVFGPSREYTTPGGVHVFEGGKPMLTTRTEHLARDAGWRPVQYWHVMFKNGHGVARELKEGEKYNPEHDSYMAKPLRHAATWDEACDMDGLI